MFGFVQCWIDNFYIVDYLVDFFVCVGGKDEFGFGVINMDCQFMSCKVFEDYGVDGVQFCIGQYGYYGLWDYGYVDNDCIVFFYFLCFEYVGKFGYVVQ